MFRPYVYILRRGGDARSAGSWKMLDIPCPSVSPKYVGYCIPVNCLSLGNSLYRHACLGHANNLITNVTRYVPYHSYD